MFIHIYVYTKPNIDTLIPHTYTYIFAMPIHIHTYTYTVAITPMCIILPKYMHLGTEEFHSKKYVIAKRKRFRY